MAEFKQAPPGAPLLVQGTVWLENRFPTLFAEYKKHMSEYYAPKNFNWMYFFGSLALLVLVIQIVTGIFLTMNYKPDAGLAFASVEYIMRDVPWGWLIRYLHSTGASAWPTSGTWSRLRSAATTVLCDCASHFSSSPV